MMSASQIADIADQAARKAKRAKRQPTTSPHTPTQPIFCHSEFNKDYLAEMEWGIIHCASFRMPYAEFKRRATEANAAPALVAALESAVKYLEANRPTGKIQDIYHLLNQYENDVMKPARAALESAEPLPPSAYAGQGQADAQG